MLFPIEVDVDNKEAILLTRSPFLRQRTEQIDVKYHFVMDKGVI